MGRLSLTRWLVGGGWFATALGVTLSASAEPAAQAVVWYRSSEGCADGPAFMELLGERRALARLAAAGDHVDFVVTVAVTEDGATGRVERQTQTGTVAMREVDDASCDRVTEVLALHLALALDPEQGAGPPAAEEPPAPAPPVPDEPEPKPAPPEPKPAPVVEPRATIEPSEPAPPGWRVGMGGGALTGIAPTALGRGSVFVQLDDAVTPGFAMRLSAVGALGAVTRAGRDVTQWVLAGRFDLCPLRLGSSRLSLSPCASADLGATGASATSQDSALWSALGAHARLVWAVGGPVALEAEVGALVPLTRYELYGGPDLLYETAPVGLSAGVGASVGFM